MAQAPLDPYRRQSRKTAMWIACGAVLGALALYIGLSLSGLLARAGPESEPITAKTAEPQALAAAPIERIKMPDDVRAWLEHLERIERRRMELTRVQLADLMVKMASISAGGATKEVLEGLLNTDPNSPDPPPPTAKIGESAEVKREAWRMLRADFQSLPPPAECVPTAAAYEQALGETSAMLMEVLDAIEKSETDPQAALATLMGMKDTSSGRIDVAAKKADQGVADLCDKYNERKWFDISPDVGAGMTQKFGF